MASTRARGAQDSAGVSSRRSRGSRELLLPPLRRQGGVGEGCLSDQREPWAPPPSLPLPSQGEGPRARGCRRSCSSPGQRSAPPVAKTPAVFQRQPIDHRQQPAHRVGGRSEEHTSELQSLMRISYAVFCLKKKKTYKK